jgi:hypothetical protein
MPAVAAKDLAPLKDLCLRFPDPGWEHGSSDALMKGYLAASILRVSSGEFLYGRPFSFQPPAGG